MWHVNEKCAANSGYEVADSCSFLFIEFSKNKKLKPAQTFQEDEKKQ